MNLDEELKEVKEYMVEIELPTMRNKFPKDEIDMMRKVLTHKFKTLLKQKIDKDSVKNGIHNEPKFTDTSASPGSPAESTSARRSIEPRPEKSL